VQASQYFAIGPNETVTIEPKAGIAAAAPKLVVPEVVPGDAMNFSTTPTPGAEPGGAGGGGAFPAMIALPNSGPGAAGGPGLIIVTY
jgi:hypothetical protein